MKVTYGTGVFAPDGYEEKFTAELCCECKKLEGEIDDRGFFYCEDCYEEMLQRRAEDELEEREEYWREAEGGEWQPRKQ